MTETKPLRYFSYSRSASDADCRRKRYLSREWGGTGLAPATVSLDLVFGSILHEYLDGLAKTGSIPFIQAREHIYTEAAKILKPSQAKDWAVIGEGLLRGFVSAVWPRLMAEYDIISAECWAEHEIKPGFVFRARRDLLLKNKINERIRYVEYKSTSSVKPAWIASWAKHPQIHTGMEIDRLANNREVDEAVVIGFYKGYLDDYSGIRRSVFSQGWAMREYTMIPDYSSVYKRTKGWENFSTYDEFQGSLEPWMPLISAEDMSKQFPMTGPIFPRQDIAQKFFAQQTLREVEVMNAIESLKTCTTVEEVDAILDAAFPQNFSKCEPAWGYKCEFSPVCWIPHCGADPLADGQFTRYTPDIEAQVEL